MAKRIRVDFGLKDNKKDKKKICRTCKKEILACVCDYFMTHWLEEGEEYECSHCWFSRNNIELEKQDYARRVLERILIAKNNE